MVTFLYGLAIGNTLLGILLNERGVFTGSVFDLLRPYPLLIEFLTVSMFCMHGALFLNLGIVIELQWSRSRDRDFDDSGGTKLARAYV